MHTELENFFFTLYWEKYLNNRKKKLEMLSIKPLLKSVNTVISSTESPMVMLNATQNKHFH